MLDTNRIILGKCFYRGTTDSFDVRDGLGHGTHVTGIASAETNNDTGIAGVSWLNKILVVRVWNDAGGGCYPDVLGEAIIFAVDNGARVINFSGGGPADTTYIEPAVAYAESLGVVIVASAGNYNSWTGYKVRYPAAYSTTYGNVIAVAATDYDDERATYSCYIGGQVNVAAPGGAHDGGYPVDPGDIFSTMPNYGVPLNGYPYYVDQTYGYLPGTSMAAPHVSGLAALILSRFPSISVPQIRYVIEQTAEDVNSSTYPGWDEYLGWGRINAYEAIKFLKADTISSDETWSNCIVVVGDVTVANGVTLTIESGTIVEFAESAKLQINGVLHAIGSAGSGNIIFTAINPTERWSGIVFADPSDDALCVMKYCYIEYANSGITFLEASPNTIANITLAHCNNYGIYCESASPRISSLTISTCDVPVGISCIGNSAARIDSARLSGDGVEYSKGIHIFNSDPVIRDGTIWNFERGINICGGDPDIRDVTLTYNTECGIACNWPKVPEKEECNPCSAYIAYNYISHNHIGIKSKFASPTIFHNKILLNDSIGVYCSGTTTPNLGVDATPDSGYNEICNNIWNVYSECSETVMAENNWWGHVHPDTIASKLYGSVDYIPYLFQSPDNIPPKPITDLTATLVDTCIFLEWTAVTTDTLEKEDPVKYYVVYRDTTAGFFPTCLESISTVDSSSYLDCGVVGDTLVNYFYSVRAVDFGYNMSSASNQVGEFDKYLPSCSFNDVSWPLIVSDTHLQAVFADSMGHGVQLTGANRLSGSDYVDYWDGNGYLTAWYKTTGENPGWKFENGTFYIEPDKSYRIVIRSGNPAVTLTMTGAVSDTHRIIPVRPGGVSTDSLTWVGYCFAVPCSISGSTGDDANLLVSGFTGANRLGGSDQLSYFDGEAFFVAWYKSTIPEWRYEGTASVIDHLEPGRGYILTVKSGHTSFNTWTLEVPPDYSKSAMVSKTRVAPERKSPAKSSKRMRRSTHASTTKSLAPDKAAEGRKTR